VDPATYLLSLEFVDFNNNGAPDLVTVSEGVIENLKVFENESSAGNKAFTPLASDATNIPYIEQPLSGLVTGDYDLNGYVDILALPSAADEVPHVYMNGVNGNGGEFSRSVAFDSISGGNIYGGASHDWNDDGDLDLYLGRGPVGSTDFSESFYFQNMKVTETDTVDVLPGVNFRKIRLHSPHFGNPSAIGAKVQLFHSNGTATAAQWVCGGTGRGTQKSRILTFGIPETASVDSMQVTWPDGYSETKGPSFPGLNSTALLAVEDSRVVAIDASSITGTFTLVPDDLYFEFEYYANRPLADMRVRFFPDPDGTNPSDCLCGGGTNMKVLKEGVSGVTIKITQTGPNEYRHYLKWDNWCCAGDCNYAFGVNGWFGDAMLGPIYGGRMITKICLTGF